MPRLRYGDLVEIHWKDAAGDSGWRDEKEMTTRPPDVWTVGYVLKNGRKALTVVQSTGRDGTVDHSMCIPRAMIVEVIVLKVA